MLWREEPEGELEEERHGERLHGDDEEPPPPAAGGTRARGLHDARMAFT